MFTKNLGGITILALIVAIVVLSTMYREHLTGNAPKELPLPSQMNPEDDKGKVGTYDKRFLDTREIPTGTSTDTSYLLSPAMVQAHARETTAEPVQHDDNAQMQAKIDKLTKEIEDLKKTMQATAGQAAAAQASLGAIPNTGVNTVMPLATNRI